MKLIYINKIGTDWKGKLIYELIFSKSDDVDGEGWDVYPARNQAESPEREYIDMVGRIETDELSLICIQESDTFAVWDAIDGVVAIAWEDISSYSEYPDNRLSFFFGDSVDSVKDKLYAKDIIIEWKYEKDEVSE